MIAGARLPAPMVRTGSSDVPRGKHRIEVLYHSPEPFFFTTTSDLEVDEDATVNFGIGYSLSGLMGQVLNDAGQGVAGVTVGDPE